MKMECQYWIPTLGFHRATGTTMNFSRNLSYSLKDRLAAFILEASGNGLYREPHIEVECHGDGSVVSNLSCGITFKDSDFLLNYWNFS